MSFPFLLGFFSLVRRLDSTDYRQPSAYLRYLARPATEEEEREHNRFRRSTESELDRAIVPSDLVLVFYLPSVGLDLSNTSDWTPL